jgi:hypothetical protein
MSFPHMFIQLFFLFFIDNWFYFFITSLWSKSMNNFSWLWYFLIIWLIVTIFIIRYVNLSILSFNMFYRFIFSLAWIIRRLTRYIVVINWRALLSISTGNTITISFSYQNISIYILQFYNVFMNLVYSFLENAKIINH